MRILPAKQATDTGAVPYALNTLYKMHCEKKNPAFVFKVNGRLMVDLDEFENMAIRARDAHVKTAERMTTIE